MPARVQAGARDGRGGVLDWVWSAARRHPDAPAIDGGAGAVSYRDLLDAVDRVATHLIGRPLPPGSPVAVLLSDRTHVILSMLAIWRAGCVFAPLDPRTPPLRLERILARLGPEAIIADADLHALVRNAVPGPGGDRAVIGFGDLEGPPRRAGRRPVTLPDPPGPGLDADAPAYVYFTSGSTGQPKGVVGRLGALSRRIRWEITTLGVAPGWRVSQVIVPTFDPFFRDVLVPLSVGGTVCLPQADADGLEPASFVQWLGRERIDLVHCVPAFFALLASAPPAAGPLEDLRWVLLSGDFLHVASVRRWQQRFGTRIRLLNLYGSTEATMVQFFHVVQDRDLDAGVIPIGRPMEGDRARLLDGHDRPCSPGNVGELCIESPSLSLGYHRDAEATRASFRTPAGHGVPDRYRTGDLAMELPDGTYRLLGRKDDQVKVRGVRVEPREVEAALVEHPQIAECAVTGQSEGDRGASLAAYVVCTSPDRPSVTDLRLHLSQRLPQEMMPAQVVFLDRLPRGPNGKVDRAALPLPGTVPSPEGRVAPPRTRIEQALVHIWSDVLGLPSVGIHDHFADRGGHSLMAMQIVTRIREALGVDLPVRAILEQSTIAQLAAEIAGRRVPTLPDGGAGPAEREARSP